MPSLTKPTANHRRFFYHYNKIKKCLTVHFANKCLLTDNVTVLVPTESKDNKSQPHKTIQGWCTNINYSQQHTIIS